MSLLSFVEWLASTRWSIALHESLYLYPLIESAHVLTLGLFVGLAAMIDLRLLGLTMRRVPVSEVTARLVPWTKAGFVVMVITGALLFYAIPVRTYQSVFFRVKVGMLLLAGLNVWLFHARVEPRVADWDLAPVTPLPARVAAVRLARPLGGHRRRGPDDRLQLVRLRHPATVRFHQLGRRLRRSTSMTTSVETSLLPLFEWCEATAIGHAIRDSVWLFPVIEAGHLLGLCVLGGSLLVVDLRMLGVGLRRVPLAELAQDVRPWLLGSIGVMAATGTALFLSESVKCYYSQAFWVKITTIPLALLFTLTVRQRVARAGTLETTARHRIVAMMSLALWFTVAAAGRWIGFS